MGRSTDQRFESRRCRDTSCKIESYGAWTSHSKLTSRCHTCSHELHITLLGTCHCTHCITLASSGLLLLLLLSLFKILPILPLRSISTLLCPVLHGVLFSLLLAILRGLCQQC